VEMQIKMQTLADLRQHRGGYPRRDAISHDGGGRPRSCGNV
jgi:hypothetical protein